VSRPLAPAAVSALPRAVLLALVAHTLISAGTHLAARAATTSLPPGTVAVLRMVGTALVFTLLVAFLPAFRGMHLPPRGTRLLFFGWGFVAGPLNQGLFLFGIERSVASHAALLYALTPIGVYLTSVALGRERWLPRRLLGVGVAFVGVVVLLFERGLAAALGPLLGDLLILGAVAAWVAWTLASRELARQFTGLQMAAWTMIAAGVQAALASPFFVDSDAALAMSVDAALSLAYLIGVTSVVSYILWSFALVRVEASRVAVFTNLQPIATAIFAFFILGEPIGWGLALGGGLVILGVRVVQRARAV
jgi:drug/metabolite transporter (DMT)-like permease